MQQDLIELLEILYIKYGNTEEVIKLSNIVDSIIVSKQKVEYLNYKNNIN